MFRLSICIPTYQRVEYLDYALSCILEQADLSVQIVVSDNASSDSTRDLVLKYQSIYPNIKYHRWDENVGPDRNFLKTVEIADGEYCWLFGDDDAIEPNGLRVVLKKLETTNPIGLSVGVQYYESDLITKRKKTKIVDYDNDIDFSDPQQAFAELAPFFGYLTGQIVKRSNWMYITYTYPVESFLNSYVHVYIIGQMLFNVPNWHYIATPIVSCRQGNDSFLKQGMLRRIEYDINGYKEIMLSLPINKKSNKKIMNRILSVYTINQINTAKLAHSTDSKFVKEVFKLLLPTYKYNIKFWFVLVPFLIIPNNVTSILRSLKKLLKI